VRVIAATRSHAKLPELCEVLVPLGYDVVNLAHAGVAEHADEEGLEQFETFEENALAKARYFHARLGHSAPGVAVIADDSGLVVPALGGQPGVRSKRWSQRDDLSGRALDAANNEKLLAALAGIADRRAYFVSAVAFRSADRELVVRGEVAGELLREARGVGGFGYDPYFFAPELGKTLAEASSSEKGRVSHRGRALRRLVAELSYGH